MAWKRDDKDVQWTDYFNKLEAKMLCERRRIENSLESSVLAAHFWFYHQLSRHFRGFPLSVKVFTIHRKNVKKLYYHFTTRSEQEGKMMASNTQKRKFVSTFCGEKKKFYFFSSSNLYFYIVASLGLIKLFPI